MDYIERKVIKRLCKRMKEARTWKGGKKLDVNREERRSCKVLDPDDYDFEIIDNTSRKMRNTDIKFKKLNKKVLTFANPRVLAPFTYKCQ